MTLFEITLEIIQTENHYLQVIVRPIPNKIC